MRMLILIIMTFSLQACSKSLYQEGTITPGRAQVKEQRFYQQVPLTDSHETYLENIALHYDKYGDGLITVNIVYDPKSTGALAASGKAANIAATLRNYGIHNIQSDILPVSGENSLIISYAYYTAHGPKNCTTMPGYADTNIGSQKDYNIGCTVETLIAKQVARPKDLLGREASDPTTDGRSAANLVNAVRAGTFNEPLGGQQASGN